MPYFTSDHVRIALAYLAESSHSSLVSFLSMTRNHVPIEAAGVPGAEFGGSEENDVLRTYCAPEDGTPEAPFYVPFGPNRKGQTHWRPKAYAGTTLQRMRSDKSFIYAREGEGDDVRWWLAKDFAANLATRQAKALGARPLSIHHLAAWFYRDVDLVDQAAAIARFRGEFQLDSYGLVPDVFSDNLDPTLAAIPLDAAPIGPALTALLDALPSAPVISITGSVMPGATAPAVIAPASATEAEDDLIVAPGSWDITPTSLVTHTGHLKGMEEAISQAVAALRSGMHVVFTGPPGCGKTDLAQHLCAAGGFRPWLVTATDQWGTFETMGGYFPDPDEGGQVLDFRAGTVVEAIEQDRILIIDEVNRADIDKAFGELFTLLSGHSVDLMFQRRVGTERRRIRLAYGTPAPEAGVDIIGVPQSWRIIAAMNDADKASLKRLSYAFVRRFAFIPIPVPGRDDYSDLLDRTASSIGLDASHAPFVDALKALFADPEGLAQIDMSMGFAIPRAMLRHAVTERTIAGRTSDDILRSTLELYLAPQFQGRADRHAALLALVRPLLTDPSLKHFERTLTTWTGFRTR